MTAIGEAYAQAGELRSVLGGADSCVPTASREHLKTQLFSDNEALRLKGLTGVKFELNGVGQYRDPHSPCNLDFSFFASGVDSNTVVSLNEDAISDIAEFLQDKGLVQDVGLDELTMANLKLAVIVHGFLFTSGKKSTSPERIAKANEIITGGPTVEAA